MSTSFDTPRSLRTMADENLQGALPKQSQQRFPDLRKPLRIELPAYFNTPRRSELAEQEEKGLPGIGRFTVESEERVRIQKRLKDYQHLALACRRAKKAKDEGRAYYSMGVLLDNIGCLTRALEYYERFLVICKAVNDQHGEALAYNCLGVDYQLLAVKNKEYYGNAISFHKKHRDISDVHGKFIAHINLGLLYASMSTVLLLLAAVDDKANSNINYQFALKYAVMLASPVGQSLALGNMTELMPGPHGKIKEAAEQYLTLCEEMNNRKAEGVAYMQLGKICVTERNYAKGNANFARALRVTKETKDPDAYNEAMCNFAYTNAQLKLEGHFDSILKSIRLDNA